MTRPPALDVTDLFDAFHRVVSLLWEEFGRASAADEDEESIPFDEIVDQLELDVFLPACGRRMRQELQLSVDPDEVSRYILLVGEDGKPLVGASGRYHSHAFHPETLEGDVPNAVLAADLMPRQRPGIRLVVQRDREERVSGSRRSRLPVH